MNKDNDNSRKLKVLALTAVSAWALLAAGLPAIGQTTGQTVGQTAGQAPDQGPAPVGTSNLPSAGSPSAGSPSAGPPSGAAPSSGAPSPASAPAASPAANSSGSTPAAPQAAQPIQGSAAPAASAPAATAAASAAASAAARQSLLPLAQPLWSDLKPQQQAVLAPFATQWNSWPLEEKLAWVAVADRYPKMSRAEHTRINQRIHDWAHLTPDQRRQARANYRLVKQLPNDERVAQWQQYNTLTEEQKKVLQQSGSTSNTGARHAGARTALAKEASQPLGQAGAGRSSGPPAPASGLVPTKH